MWLDVCNAKVPNFSYSMQNHIPTNLIKNYITYFIKRSIVSLAHICKYENENMVVGYVKCKSTNFPYA